MPAVVVAIADAVAAELAAAPLSQSFVPVRAYVPTFGRQEEDVDEFATLRVTVVPRETSAATAARTPTHAFDYVVDVAVQQRVEAGPLTDAELNAQCDPLMQLVEEIVDLFRGRAPADYPRAVCVGVENPPIYIPEHLDQYRIFTSLVRLRFRLGR